MSDKKFESNLRMLTLSQFNAAVNRGIESRQEKIPSKLRIIARKFIAGASAPTGSKQQSDLIANVDESKKKQIKELASYQKRMDKKRQSLLSLGKNATQMQYLDAGLPLVNKDAIENYTFR